MSANQWYIPNSLRNMGAGDGNVTGFRFAYRVGHHYTIFFVAHSVSLFLDGAELPNPHLRLVYKGATVPVEQLPETDWACCLRGSLIEVLADFPGGLRKGRHQLRLEAIFGGWYGASATRTPMVLCDFTANV